MSPDIQIREKLAAIRMRLRWLTVEERISWCLLPGLLIALGMLAAHKLDRLDDPYALMALAVGVPLLSGMLWGFLVRISVLDAARLADRKLGLKERMSNAVIFADSPDASPLVPAILRDAAEHAERISPGSVIPYRATRSARWSLFTVVLLVAAWFAPHYPLGRTPGEIAVRQEMREQGQRLRQVAQKAKEQAKTRKLGTPAELARKLEKLAKELEKAKLSKKQALLKTGKLAAELREAQKLAALAAGRGSLGRAAAALRNVPFATGEMQDIARAVREQRIDEAASKLSKLAKALRDGKFDTPQAQEELADDLRKMAEAAKAGGMDELASALSEAAEQLAQGNTDAAAEAMERAAEAAAQAAESAAANQTLEEMAQELEESQREVAEADQEECETCGSSSCSGASPGGG